MPTRRHRSTRSCTRACASANRRFGDENSFISVNFPDPAAAEGAVLQLGDQVTVTGTIDPSVAKVNVTLHELAGNDFLIAHDVSVPEGGVFSHTWTVTNSLPGLGNRYLKA